MPTLDCFGQTVTIDDEGFLVDESEWTPEVAEALARRMGIFRMTDRHWKVIAGCREHAARGDTTLRAEHITEFTGFTLTELDRLFPGGSGYTVARIAGLPKPPPHVEARSEPKEAES